TRTLRFVVRHLQSWTVSLALAVASAPLWLGVRRSPAPAGETQREGERDMTHTHRAQLALAHPHRSGRRAWRGQVLGVLLCTACVACAACAPAAATTAPTPPPTPSPVGRLAATIHLGEVAQHSAVGTQGLWFLNIQDGLADEVDPTTNQVVASIKVGGIGLYAAQTMLAIPELNAL